MIFPARKKKTPILASQMDQTFTSFFSPVFSPAQNLMLGQTWSVKPCLTETLGHG